MRQQLIFSAAVAASAALVGCAKGSSSGSPVAAPLSSEQEARFYSTVDEVGRASKLQETPTSGASSVTSRFADTEASPAAKPERLDIDPAKMNACKGVNENNAAKGMSMKVGGEGCPVEFSFSMEFDGDASSSPGSMTMHMKFELKDASVAKNVDVYGFEYGYKAGMTGTANSAKVTIGGGGLIKSRKDGEIKMVIHGEGSGNAEKSEFVMSTKFAYADGTVAELTQSIVRSASGTGEACALNGKVLEKAKCEEVKGKLNIQTIQASGPSNETPPAHAGEGI